MCSFVQPFELPMCINCALPSFKSTSCHLYFTPKKKKCEEFKGYQTLSVTTLECFKSQKQKSEPSMDRQLVLQGCAGQLVRRREHLLSCVTLGSGVERGQLHTVKVLRPHLKQNLLKRVKLAARSIHVVLIDLDTVDKDKKKKNDNLEAMSVQNRAALIPTTEKHYVSFQLSRKMFNTVGLQQTVLKLSSVTLLAFQGN